MPICEGDLDQCIGIIHVKYAFRILSEGKPIDLRSLSKSPAILSTEDPLPVALRKMMRWKVHMALVRDEFGGIDGVITLEDILEEVVGEIQDEFDAEEIAYSRLDERTFIIEAKTALIDVYRILGLADEAWEGAKGESDTLGGFVTEQSGRIMRSGESLIFEGVELKIDAATPRKLLRIKLTLPEHDRRDGI